MDTVKTEYCTITFPTPLENQVDGKVNESKSRDIIDSNHEDNTKTIIDLNNELRKIKILIAVMGAVFITVLLAAILLASLAAGNTDRNKDIQLENELGKLKAEIATEPSKLHYAAEFADDPG